MTTWGETVKFRDILEMYDANAEDELAEVTRLLPVWTERFNTIPSLKHFVPLLKKVKTESQMNKWLEKVFDYCDDWSIWVAF